MTALRGDDTRFNRADARVRLRVLRAEAAKVRRHADAAEAALTPRLEGRALKVMESAVRGLQSDLARREAYIDTFRRHHRL